MATPQQIYYQNHRDAVREYKKAHYAKKTHRKEIALFKNIQLKGKTKGESRKIIKNAIQAGTLAIKCITPEAQRIFEEQGHWSKVYWCLESWIDNKHPPIRTDQGIIMVDYVDYQDHFTIILEPWILVEPITI